MSTAYAEVIGDPINQSKSPLIHNFWLEKLGIDGEYRACHVRPDELVDYFSSRRADKAWRGCNVTMPHKQTVQSNLDTIDRRGGQVGAVNTVVVQGGELKGFNTDVAGILAALPGKLMPPGVEVCILGSGGAARAALAACQERRVAGVLLSVRNQQLGTELLKDFRIGGTVRPIDDARNIQTAQVIINATPLGMRGGAPMPARILELLSDAMPQAVVFDMVYSPVRTDFLRVAADAGCPTVDGLAMLIGQAAGAFERFFGRPAPRQHDAELRALLTQ